MTALKHNRRMFADLCRVLGKSTVCIRNIQTSLDLPIPPEREGYGPEYEAFLRTVIFLRTFGVPMEAIADLFSSEKKLLVLLKIDTLSGTPTWFMDQCGKASAPDCLLLTNHPLGGMVSESGVQSNLDFSNRSPELFKSSEMGEDARRVLESCRKKTESIMTRVKSEVPVLRQALAWAEDAGRGIAT